MSIPGSNLFIVDSDKAMVAGLRQYLDNRFGDKLNISAFYTGESCLEKIDQHTRFVILAYFFNGINGNEVLKSIKQINPETEVIMHTSNEEIGTAIDSFRSGATDYVIKGEHARRKIYSIVSRVILYPVHVMVKELGINKYLAMFLLSFVGLGIVVFVSMKILN